MTLQSALNKNLIPQNNKQEHILGDLKELARTGTAITSLMDDLRDDPNAYAYSEHDLQHFLFIHEIHA